MQLLILIFTVCVISGVFTGLLGIGGGLIIVPAFLIALPIFKITGFGIHQIIGISATCVFFNSLSTLFYRRKENFLPLKFVSKIAIFIIIGTLLGSWVSSGFSKALILGIYSVVSITSIYFIKSDIHFDLCKKETRFWLYVIFALIGAVSSTVGIGGAIFFATTLKCFFNQNAKELLPSITLIVAIHALTAFLSKMALGEITLVMIPVAVVSSLIGAKIGVMISEKLSAKTITNLMVIMLLLSLLRVILEFFI